MAWSEAQPVSNHKKIYHQHDGLAHQQIAGVALLLADRAAWEASESGASQKFKAQWRPEWTVSAHEYMETDDEGRDRVAYELIVEGAPAEESPDYAMWVGVRALMEVFEPSEVESWTLSEFVEETASEWGIWSDINGDEERVKLAARLIAIVRAVHERRVLDGGRDSCTALSKTPGSVKRM